MVLTSLGLMFQESVTAFGMVEQLMDLAVWIVEQLVKILIKWLDVFWEEELQ